MPCLFDWEDPDISQYKRAEYHRILRAVPRGRNLEAACELGDLKRRVLAAGVRTLYPDITEREIAAKLAWLWLPNELWEKVYGPHTRDGDQE